MTTFLQLRIEDLYGTNKYSNICRIRLTLGCRCSFLYVKINVSSDLGKIEDIVYETHPTEAISTSQDPSYTRVIC